MTDAEYRKIQIEFQTFRGTVEEWNLLMQRYREYRT